MFRSVYLILLCCLLLTNFSRVLAADSASVIAEFDVACDLAGRSELERKAAIRDIVLQGSVNEDYFISMIDSDTIVQRQIAAEVLGSIGSLKSEKVLLQALDNKDVFLQGAAARALAVLYSRLPQDILVARLRSTDKTIVSMAVMYGAYKRARYAKEALEPDLLTAVGDLLAVVKDINEVQAAVMVLKYANTQEAVMALLKIAGTTDNLSVKIEICRALEAIAPEGKAPTIEELAMCGISAVEVEAWAALSAMGYKDTDKSLVVLATSPIPAVQARAIEALAKYAGSKYDQLYIAALKSPVSDVRLQALYALESTNSVHSASEIAKMMGPAGDEDPFIRAESALIFAKLTHSGGLGPLLKDSRNENEKMIEFRLAAIRALGELGDSGALRALIDMLRDDDMLVRVEAATSLGMIGDKRALKSLLEEQKNRKGEELMVLKQAIEQINK